jgi:hypothetical protein
MRGKDGQEQALREVVIGKVVAARMDVDFELLPEGRR